MNIAFLFNDKNDVANKKLGYSELQKKNVDKSLLDSLQNFPEQKYF